MGDPLSSHFPPQRRLDPVAIRRVEREIATLRQHLTRVRNRPEIADAKTLRTYEEMIEQRLQLLPRAPDSHLIRS